MLEWLENPALSRRVNAGLSKGEAKNALVRAVIFNRLGDLRDRSFESQRYRASRLNLAVAAIVAWNTVYLERAVASLSVPGKEIRTDLLTHLSPLGWEHITLPGITFGTPTNVSLKGALPLRAPIQVSFWSYRAKNSVS